MRGDPVVLSSRMRHLRPSSTLAVMAQAARLKQQGVDVISFGAGEPDYDTPTHIKEAAIAAIREGFTKYTEASGTDELKDAILAKLTRDNGVSYSREEVTVGCGGKHVLFNVMAALCEEGDEVLIPSPYWVSFPEQVRLVHARPVTVETREEEGFRLTRRLLEAVWTPRAKALILNSPCNPTGAMVSPPDLTEIAAFAVEKNIFVISDECYEAFIYDGRKHVSIATLGEEIKGRTIVVHSASKTYAMTGWRIGYAAGPREIIQAMSAFQSQVTSNPTSIAQKAVRTALLGPQDSVAVMREDFDRRRRFIVERLLALPGVRCVVPQGAFYVFPNISAFLGRRAGETVIETPADLAVYLLSEARVAVVPGEDFGSGHHIRLSYATSQKNIETGVSRMAAALRPLLPAS